MKKLNIFLENYNKKYFKISNIDNEISSKIGKLYKLILNLKKKIKKL